MIISRKLCSLLNFREKRKVLDIIVSGKGVILYEKIVLIDSLNSKPENAFFSQRMNFLAP